MTGSPGRKVAAIAAVELVRFGRDRWNLFFVFVLPIAIIVLVGMQFGGESIPRLGVAGDQDGAVARAVLVEVRAAAEVELVSTDPEELATKVESGGLDGAVSFPPDLDRRLEAGAEPDEEPEPVRIGFVAGRTQEGQQLRAVVDGALARAMVVPTAERALVAQGADPEEAAEAVRRAGGDAGGVVVRTVTAGDRLFPEGTAGADVAAPAQLVLFSFVTGLTGSAGLILLRQLGVGARMRSTPTSMGTVILGLALGRWLIAVVQGAYVLVATWALFDVDWGDLSGALAVLAAVSAVSAAAALCFGGTFSEPQQAASIGLVVALAFAALGGAMLPVELFSDTLATVARATPHFWALDAFAELIRHEASLGDVLPQLGVLIGMTAALLALGTWRLRVALTTRG